jgi:hypothetical protein
VVPPPPQLTDLQGRLLSAARQISRLSKMMRKSTNSFQAFIERQDVRQDQQAKMVCMHLAVLCLDMGMAPGEQVILHAKEAIKSLLFGDLKGS